MELQELVRYYRSLVSRTGEPVALMDFGLPRATLEDALCSFDEDYQISRFLQFSRDPETPVEAAMNINGAEYTHLLILPEVDSLLRPEV